MQISFKQIKDTGIIILDGDLNVVKVDAFRQEFNEWFSPNTDLKDVVVDLSDVPMIDSAGLGLLIAFLKQVRERGGDLALCGIQKRVSLVFDITRTKRIFDIFETRELAIASFSE
ncbi:STAS domain-containing protein [Kiritimatiellaeota bacterium B1221]|nr:STAS domain-containing protein [Kiritimatiellaeota bacterium B1221]